MEHITNQLTAKLYTSRAFRFYFGGMKLASADIETTGLSPRSSRFVLGGLLLPSAPQETQAEGTLRVHQFFAETLEQEQETLSAYLSALKKSDVLLTYNGQRFDLPFLKGRAGEAAKQLPFNLDLFLLVKNYSPIRKFLPNLKQKTVENYMGLWSSRKDEISGKESVELYYRYLAEGDPSVKRTILLHNHDDIVQLYRLLPVLEKMDLHRAMYHMGFPIRAKASEISNLAVEKIQLSGNELNVSGRQGAKTVSYHCFEHEGIPCFAVFKPDSKTFRISLPLLRQAGLTLVDLRAMRMDTEPFHKYPSCQEGFLILENGGEKNYLEINHFIKAFLERMLNQWITKKQQQR